MTLQLSFFISDFFWFAERLVSVNSVICSYIWTTLTFKWIITSKFWYKIVRILLQNYFVTIVFVSKTWASENFLLTVLFPNTFFRSTFAISEYFGSSAAYRPSKYWLVSMIHYQGETIKILNKLQTYLKKMGQAE
jgi:hypothetical protein